jgi:hypothetical protein
MQHIKHTYIKNETHVKAEESSRLRLPSQGLVMYDDADIEDLSQINNEDDLLSLMQEYILGTMSEVIRLVERVAVDDPVIPSLKFKLASSLCSAHHARWDIFALVSSSAPRCMKLHELTIRIARN